MPNQELPKSGAVAFFWMLKGVLEKSIEKGQFLLALTGVVVLALLLRVSQPVIDKLAISLFESLFAGQLLCYPLCVFLIFAWKKHVNFLQDKHAKELERVSEERNFAQQASINKPLKSTKKPAKPLPPTSKKPETEE